MNKYGNSPNFSYRPAVLAGLYFFVISLLPAYAREPASLQLFKPLLINGRYAPPDLPDSSQVHFGTSFAPLYSEKDRESHGDSQHVELRARGFSGGVFSGCGSLKYYLTFDNAAFDAIYRKSSDGYYFVSQRQEWNVAGGAAYRRGALLVGVGLGRHLPRGMLLEHRSDIQEDPGLYLRRSAWQSSFDMKVDFGKTATRLSLFSGPVHSSVSKFVTIDETSFRSFPFSIIRHSADAGFDVSTGKFSASTTFGIDYFEDSDLLKAHNSMPQDVAISNYRLEHHGMLRLPCTDSLGWNLSGSMAGGWVASYNFDRNRFTFFKSEGVRFYNEHAEIGARLPGSLTGGVSQAVTNGTSPTGFLKLSALSAWSVFRPLDYKYTDAEITYRETGCFINRKFALSRFEIVPQLYASHIAAKLGLSTSHKEIAVLIPVYVDTVAHELFNTRLVLFEPSITVLARLGRIQMTGSVHQELPVVIASGKKPDQTETPDTRRNANVITGGTRLDFAAIWHIPASVK